MNQMLEKTLEHLHFPNESPSYRQARNALLQEEMELRRRIERLAAQRRALPQGGEIPEDYVFEAHGPDGKPAALTLSGLFAPGTDTLAIYSFMFGPSASSRARAARIFWTVSTGRPATSSSG